MEVKREGPNYAAYFTREEYAMVLGALKTCMEAARRSRTMREQGLMDGFLDMQPYILDACPPKPLRLTRAGVQDFSLMLLIAGDIIGGKDSKIFKFYRREIGRFKVPETIL